MTTTATAIAARVSWPARQQLFASANTVDSCRHDARDPEMVAIAEWFMARARREFARALWADAAVAA